MAEHEQITMNDVEYEILNLVVDGTMPYGVVFPEVRRDVQADLDVAEFDRLVRSLVERNLARLHVRDGGINPRAPTSADHKTVVGDYTDGDRDPDKVGQIFDRPDIWVDVTDLGRVAAAGVRPSERDHVT